MEQLLEQQGARTSVQRLRALQEIEDRLRSSIAWLRVEEVRLMRSEGSRWPAIGAALGCSKQWAQRQFEPLMDTADVQVPAPPADRSDAELVTVEETLLVTPRRGTPLLKLVREVRQRAE